MMWELFMLEIDSKEKEEKEIEEFESIESEEEVMKGWIGAK
jgi:hypothetical protein